MAMAPCPPTEQAEPTPSMARYTVMSIELCSGDDLRKRVRLGGDDG